MLEKHCRVCGAAYFLNAYLDGQSADNTQNLR